ncbi:MAG: heavy metal translocating P-type ATPase, partial [Candidatus Saccharimonadales bacterium]
LKQYWTAITLTAGLGFTKLLNNYARLRAGAPLNKLLDAKLPKTSKLIKGKRLSEVSVAKIRPGDVLQLVAGEIVPADAVITAGESSVDETALFACAEASSKTIGDRVLAGSINLDGDLVIQVLFSADDSLTRQLKRLARAGLASEAPLSRLTDKFNLPFLALVSFMAVVSGLLGHSGLRSLEILAVATPACLILTAPLAFLAGLNQAACRGIFVRSAAKLEILAAAQTIAFSKNGTLTNDNFELDNIKTYAGFSKIEVLSWAAALEQNSSHPLAKPIIQATLKRNLKIIKVKNVQQVSGGLSATLKSAQILLGNAKFLELRGVELPKDVKKLAKTTALLAVSGQLAGVLQFANDVRPEAAAMVAAAKASGLNSLTILTGDSPASAQALGKKLGLKVSGSQLPPAEKLYGVESLAPRPVVFVGDGVSDAAALMSADVGLAFNVGQAPAGCESAGAVITQPNLDDVALVLDLARQTPAIAKQNILAGLIVTLGLIMVFASGRFTPIFGAIIQEFITVFVVVLTLARFKALSKR